MVLVIDACNIRSGGGLSHLKGILDHYNSKKYFSKIVIYSNLNTLNSIKDQKWLEKKTHKYLNRSFIWSFFFQIFLFSKIIRKNDNPSILFVPGGTFLGSFRPFVTMSRNMLPFELKEAFRFKDWKVRIKFLLLRLSQSFSYRKAKSVIFLTNYARDIIISKIPSLEKKNIIIPHGINKRFISKPKKQNKISYYNDKKKFRFLYVSIVNAYKHQWNVSEAILKLRNEGFPVCLDLIGPLSKESYNKLYNVINSKKNNQDTVRYLGSINHDDLPNYYFKSDAFVFASSCENLPNILIEAMSSGLPIASSNMGPMPEVLSNGGVYFNPLDVDSIYDALKKIMIDNSMRTYLSITSYNRTKNFTWKECSNKTFNYIFELAKNQ